MLTDRFGHQHSCTNEAAVALFEDATFAVAAHRPLGSSLTQALELDPDFVSAYALRSIGQTLLARREMMAGAAKDAAAAHDALVRAGGGTTSERALVTAAMEASGGRLLAAAACLEQHLAEEPRHFLITKAAHAMRFMTGQPSKMLASTATALTAWRETDPGFGFLLGCHAFALEELGHYREAEIAGRRAVALEPADAWGLHAVSHVMEMSQRVTEGIDWLAMSRPLWPQCNNFRFHLAWHLCLFHLEAGEEAMFLTVYDRDVMPTASDDFRDMANAASLLWRAGQAGVDVASRWDAIRQIALHRAEDNTYVFASLHYLMALVATGERDAAARLIDALEARAQAQDCDQSQVARAVGIELARVLGRTGRSDGPTLLQLGSRLAQLGGSNAQRDVFMRALLVAAVDGGSEAAITGLTRQRQQLRAEDRFARRIAASATIREARGAA